MKLPMLDGGRIYAVHIGYGPVVFVADDVQALAAQPGNAAVGVVFKSGFSLVVLSTFEQMHEMLFHTSSPAGLMRDHGLEAPRIDSGTAGQL